MRKMLSEMKGIVLRKVPTPRKTIKRQESFFEHALAKRFKAIADNEDVDENARLDEWEALSNAAELSE